MKLDIYVNYKGNCRKTFRFYQQHLGGKITSMMTFSQLPASANIPEGRQNKIMHARMEIGGPVLMGADIPNAEPMRSAYLTITFDSAEEAERVYELLSDEGEIFTKIQETSFASRYAMFRDRFGASWMLLCQC